MLLDSHPKLEASFVLMYHHGRTRDGDAARARNVIIIKAVRLITMSKIDFFYVIFILLVSVFFEYCV